MFAVFILGENTKHKPKKAKLIFKEIRTILICENADDVGIFCLDIIKIDKPLTHLLKEYDESKSWCIKVGHGSLFNLVVPTSMR